MLQFHLCTKTPSNMEQRGEEVRGEEGERAEREKEGMKGKRKEDKESIEGEDQ